MAKRNSFLDKKITTGESIGNVLAVVILIGLFIMIKWAATDNYYQYEDLHGNMGNSRNCYTREDGLYCTTDIKVEWYGEK